MPEISIGQLVDIVIENGAIRQSSVQDLAADRIVFLQITPPLSAGFINKTIIVTYLPQENRHIRRCFPARVVEIREGYVTVGRGFPVIIAEPLDVSKDCDLRAYERHKPQSEITIFFDTDLLKIVDISSVGAHLIRDAGRKPLLKVDDIILLRIQTSTGQFERSARIVRLWHSRGADGPQHLAVTFSTGKSS